MPDHARRLPNPLPEGPALWIPGKSAFSSWSRLASSISPEAICRSGILPGVHWDPFDRLLAAQAIQAGITILSPDAPPSALEASQLW